MKRDPNRAHVVYRAFDSDGRLLYVGMTSNLCGRLTTHRRNGVWYQEAAVWTIEGFADRSSAWKVEQAAIYGEHPLHNVNYRQIGKRGWIGRRWAKYVEGIDPTRLAFVAFHYLDGDVEMWSPTEASA